MAKAHEITGVAPKRSYHENARIILPQKVGEVYTWEPFIWDETRHRELHNMRISIRRLRYTMDVFRAAYRFPKTPSEAISVNYSERFAEFFAVILDLQEILGDIHDCDVVLEVLTDYGTQSEQGTVALGIAKLITQTRETRNADYKTFLEKWAQLSASDFKQELLSFLAS